MLALAHTPLIPGRRSTRVTFPWLLDIFRTAKENKNFYPQKKGFQRKECFHFQFPRRIFPRPPRPM
jgi:hypothetical protein